MWPPPPLGKPRLGDATACLRLLKKDRERIERDEDAGSWAVPFCDRYCESVEYPCRAKVHDGQPVRARNHLGRESIPRKNHEILEIVVVRFSHVSIARDAGIRLGRVDRRACALEPQP